ncbi:MAG: putative Rossmann fold flavoprotein [Polaribacter sp.]|jgi:predicted Rossmann fold flavoprotein
MNSNYQIIIIGAGAAGLFCAINAAKRGRKVLVLDHANKLGKKILMSGGGRCNFTNYSIEPENYVSANSHFCKSALSRFNQWQFLELVDQYNIKYFDKGQGELFCENSSKDIRDLLVDECQLNNVRIQLKSSIVSIEKKEESFSIQVLSNTTKGSTTSESEQTTYHCESLVIATGGLSIPSMGATGFGYEVAEQFGHKILATRPGLSPLTFENKWLNKTKGLPGNSANVLVSCNNHYFKDALLFTHKGLSGPSILQISNYWKKGDPIVINWLPDINVTKWFCEVRQTRPDIQLKALLATQFSQSLAEFLCAEFFSLLGNSKLQSTKLKQFDHADIDQLDSCLTAWVTYPKDYEGYKVAEVTIGGVNTDEVSSKSMESDKQKGLYLIGEVLDVTGQLGGYNFQWAWASGAAAAEFV